MKILTCNVGSTSLKFKLYEMPQKDLLASGKIERVGTDDAIYHYENPISGIEIDLENQSVPDYLSGISRFLSDLTGESTGAIGEMEEIEVVGFKTVLAKGYHTVHELTEEVMQGMQFYMGIAGSHNGPYMAAIRQFEKLLPHAKRIGSFETGFHRTIPLARRMYGIPYDWYERFGIERMGYHGASHGYIASRLTARYGAHYRAISCHLGGSCSLCAIKDGKSVDTSFGMSLQTGILHANRAGDTDTSLVPFLMSLGMSLDQIQDGLVRHGGMLGISGVSNDMRYIEAAAAQGDERAQLAIDVFVQNLVRTIGSFYAELGGLDCLVFTGGIGENDPSLREAVCQQLTALGVALDPERNRTGEGERVLSRDDAAACVLVLPTNEEVEVATRVYDYLTANN